MAASDPVTAVTNLISSAFDRFIPDPVQAAEAKLALAKADRDGDLEEVRVGLSAILVEGGSADPWTSRARPMFLYVVYILILSAIPMGIVSAINPLVAANITAGFKGWLDAIPEPMLALFGTVMLGYTISRSWDKKNGSK